MPGSISSETAIANLALTRLGASRITNIDTEQSENAAKMRAVFDFLRDEVLRSHPWSFATQRVNFNQTTNTPLYGFASEYQIPGDVLRVLPPSTGGGGSRQCEYKIEGDKILTDDSTFQARCILRIEDTTQWDSVFVDAFATRLQAELAYAIVNNRALAGDLFNLYLAKIRSAKAYNAMEDTPDPLTADLWLTERTAGSFAPNSSLGT
jgi:hypothetical protein